MTFKVEKGVPLPSRGPYRRKESPYPLDGMEVGDSFLVPCKEGEKTATVRARIRHYCRRNSTDSKYAIRVLPEGIRVWRTA